MAANQSALDLNRSIFKFLMAEKCKSYEIYGRMCEEVYLSQKMFTNGLNMGLPLWAWVEKTVFPLDGLTFQ